MAEFFVVDDSNENPEYFFNFVYNSITGQRRTGVIRGKTVEEAELNLRAEIWHEVRFGNYKVKYDKIKVYYTIEKYAGNKRRDVNGEIEFLAPQMWN